MLQVATTIGASQTFKGKMESIRVSGASLAGNSRITIRKFAAVTLWTLKL